MNNARSKASDRRPVKEIDAIMVKYSAWASSRAAEPPPPDGIREVTYSSALRATNSRRKVLTDLVLPAPEPAPSKPPRRTSQPRTPKSSAGRRRTAPVYSAIPSQNQSPLSPAKASSQIQEPSNRVVSLSVRLAAEECALVRSRAAEARLSVSAYLRQCVLDVDAMRIFVEKISTELQSSAAAGPQYASEPVQLLTGSPAAPRAFPNFVARCCNAVRRLLFH